MADHSKPTWHALAVPAVLAALRTHRDGLASPEVARRQQRHGVNALPTTEADTPLNILGRQFKAPLMLLLIAAALVSIGLGDMLDGAMIGCAVLLNVLFGFVQEYRASRALDRLHALLRPTALVRRDGRERDVPCEEVVPGDILVLREGHRVCADARVVEVSACEVNEASLTGESVPVGKFSEALAPGVDLASRTNMVYAGTTIVAGRALAVVVATGRETQLGEIAALVADTPEPETPLQRELRRLSVVIAVGVCVIVAVVFVVGIANGEPILSMFKTSVALAVAAVPEGLLMSVTVALAVGMRRILDRGSLTRRLLAAETLGSVSILCTDKTGTLTTGHMAVAELLPANTSEPEAFSGNPALAEPMLTLMEVGMLCNDATVEMSRSLREPTFRGSPTETALLSAGLTSGIDPVVLAAGAPRVAEVPFDHARKYMLTAHRIDGTYVLYAKGAPERILEACTRSRLGKKEESMTQAARTRTLREVEEMTKRGLRVLALAERRLSSRPETLHPNDLANLTFLGLVGLRDPLRTTAAEHITEAARAGVRTILITGDHPDTARTIAEEAGIRVRRDALIIGSTLDTWDEETLTRHVAGIDVYARVEPRHKLRIVRAWQQRGMTVAMTGDGVNDTPALKMADIGIALGSGTEAAKETAGLVLLDDDLGTITAAISEGRTLFANIRKMVAYVLSSCFSEIVLVGGAILVGLPSPLNALMILWINLAADGLPNAAFAFEAGEPGQMRLPPRARHERVLTRPLVFLVFGVGLITDLMVFGTYAYLVHHGMPVDHARSLLFASVGLGSILFAFALKSFHRSLFSRNPFDNQWLNVGVLIGMGLLALPFVHPMMSRAFGVVPLAWSDLPLILTLALLKVIGIEVAKIVLHNRSSLVQTPEA